jgi:hypothetical protein
MNNSEILNPKFMVPNCAELWQRFQHNLDLLNEAMSMHPKNSIQGDVFKLLDAVDGFNSMKDEIEYLTRM